MGNKLYYAASIICLFIILFALFTPQLTADTNNFQERQVMNPINGIWLHADDIGSINYAYLASVKITDIYMLTAYWNADHTLTKMPSDAAIATMLSSAHTNGLRVHAWTIRFFDQSALDLTSSANRAAAVSAATNLVTASYGGETFDGHNDDLAENFYGAFTDYAAYYNSLSTALSSAGKISSTDMLVWTGYPVETYFPLLDGDYICGMFYSSQTWSQSDFDATVPRAFTNSHIPLVIGMYYDTRIGPYTPASQLSYVSDTYNGETYFGGFSLYCGDSGGYGYIDWASWNSWTPKNHGVSSPSFNPVAGTYGATQNVVISSDSGATIYYTNDGSTPDSGDSVYSTPIEVAASVTLKAFAVKTGYADSAVSTAVYVINNPVTPSAISVIRVLSLLGTTQ